MRLTFVFAFLSGNLMGFFIKVIKNGLDLNVTDISQSKKYFLLKKPQDLNSINNQIELFVSRLR
jgi:hypothetical protein